MMEEVKLTINVGTEMVDYQGGQLLTAIDEVVAFFCNARGFQDAAAADIIRVYAKTLNGEHD